MGRCVFFGLEIYTLLMTIFKYSLLCLLGLSLTQLVSAETITFAPLPMENQRTVIQQVTPMMSYLERALASMMEVRYHKDYAELLSSFQSGEIDLIILGPLPYVSLRKEYPMAEPVVRFKNSPTSDTYTCSIVAPMDSELKSVQQLKGKRIALTQSLSTCGYLSTNGELRKEGVSLEQTQYRYTGSHREVALSVIRGEFDAGGIKTSIGKKFEHLGLRVMATSDPLPGFVLVGNRTTLSEDQIAKVRRAMLALKPQQNARHKALMKGWGKNVSRGAVNAKDSDYDGIRRLLENLEIPKQGNF